MKNTKFIDVNSLALSHRDKARARVRFTILSNTQRFWGIYKHTKVFKNIKLTFGKQEFIKRKRTNSDRENKKVNM